MRDGVSLLREACSSRRSEIHTHTSKPKTSMGSSLGSRLGFLLPQVNGKHLPTPRPENLIVSNLEDLSAVTLVLIDFGYAATNVSGGSLQGLAGSPEYAAPEVLSWLEAEVRSDEVREIFRRPSAAFWP